MLTRSRTRVQLMYNLFKEGGEDVNDDARPSRPSTSATDENIEAVKQMDNEFDEFRFGKSWNYY